MFYKKENQMADALANLVTSLTLFKDETIHVPVYHRWVLPPSPILQQEEVNTTSVLTIDIKDWRQSLIDYLEHGKIPDELRRQTKRLMYSISHVHLILFIPNTRTWSLSTSSIFLVKSFLSTLSNQLAPSLCSLVKFIWQSKTLSKIKAFYMVSGKQKDQYQLLATSS